MKKAVVMRKLLAASVAQICLVGGMLCSGPAAAMTLMQAYQAALQNDPTYLSAVDDSIAGKEYAVLGRSNLLPQVSASYSASKVRADLTQPNFLGTIGTTHPVYLSHASVLQVRQPLFSLDALARYKQGKAQSGYYAAQFDGRVQELILRVSGAYIDALYSGEQLALIQAQRDTYVEQQKVNTHLYEKGEGTKTDMLETQARLDLSEAQLLEARDAQQNARAALAALVGGVDVGELDQLQETFRIAPLPEGGFETLRKSILDHNPEVQAQVFAVEAAKQEVNKARSGHTPRVDMIASYSKSNADTLNTYNQESTNRSIGVQVNIPLYSGGAVSAQARQSSANLDKAKHDLQAKVDKLTLDLRKDFATVVSSSSRIPALDKAVASAKLLVTATEQSIKGGVRINLDLLNAKQQLFTSQRDLAQARYNYLVSMLKVKSSAGTLGPEDVHEIAGYFR
jgi:protease secretion system outer membrane protein